MSRSVRYGVQIEFTVDGVLDGGPSKAEIRRFIREAVDGLGRSPASRFASLTDVRVKYLHEATSTMLDRKAK